MTLVTQKTSELRPDSMVLEGASWELYELLVRDRDAAGQHFKITYDRGRLVMMAPLPLHERVKKLLGQLVEVATLDRGIPRASYGATTWKREDLSVGFESDECYYIGEEPEFDPSEPVDLRVEPAPDLAIEVDVTRHSLRKLALYAALGVKEVWRYDGQGVTFHSLQDSRRYEEVSRSKVLPFLSAGDVNRFVVMLSTSRELETVRAFRDWLRDQPA